MHYIRDEYGNYLKKMGQEGREHLEADEHDDEATKPHIPTPHPLAPMVFYTQATFRQ